MIAALIIAWRIRPTIRLRRDHVRAAAPPAEVFDRLRAKLVADGEFLAGEPERAVVGFSGRAGPFRYRTVEQVQFSGTTVTFRHLHGPFHRCEEALHAEPDGSGGTTIAHQGELTMGGGLVGWVFGVAVVRPLFERHVAGHLRQLSVTNRVG